ncbi:hypothetical protein TIFTF001_043568 [Ficus carica]|uniref:Uncharacterized protein n=1 Tax=Ficus carica TaxID=3494 RepID=A0AA87Z0G0_FICCA|nr:hypothetical protein TIFTF001_043568 [Ficus carica]
MIVGCGRVAAVGLRGKSTLLASGREEATWAGAGTWPWGGIAERLSDFLGEGVGRQARGEIAATLAGVESHNGLVCQGCLKPDVLREQDLWPTTSPTLAGTGHMLGRCSALSTWIREVKPVPAWHITSPTTATYPDRICPYGRQRQPPFCPPRQVRPHVVPAYWADSPCRPTYPPDTLGGQYGRVALSTQAH